MRFIEWIFKVFSPKAISKIISAVLAFSISFFGFNGISALSKNKSEGGETPEAVQTGSENDKDGTKTDKNTFSEEGAAYISAEISAESGIICDLSKMSVVAYKDYKNPTSVGDITVIASAIVVSKAINEGRITESEYAVCPATAQKQYNYHLSSEILSVGKKMSVKDILKCMIYQSGSSFAYTIAVHISGSEEAFVQELNTLAKELGMLNTVFTNVCGFDDGTAKTTVYDTVILMKHFLDDSRLKAIFCSNDELTVNKNGQESSVYLTVSNDFFKANCTESQAKADGIMGGKVGKCGFYKWSAVLFSNGTNERLVIMLGSTSPFSDALKAYASYL